jgi:iron complex outermembrane recepter protein
VRMTLASIVVALFAGLVSMCAQAVPEPSEVQSSAPPVQGSTDEGKLGEIVVTANRREEQLSKVPISITALTQDNMDNLGIKDIADIVRFTPGVSIIDQGNNVSVAIRGIGSSETVRNFVL